MTKGKHVHFESVEVREYPFVLGDNPASLYGPSFELGWEYRYVSDIIEIQPSVVTSRQETASSTESSKHKFHPSLQSPKMSIDAYESIRPSSHRRSMKQLYMFLHTREYLAKNDNNCFSDDDIQEAIQAKQFIIQSRARSTLYRNPITTFHEGNVSARRIKKIKRAVRNLKKRSRRTKDMINHSTNRTTDSTTESGNIYSGWWLPLSQFLF